MQAPILAAFITGGCAIAAPIATLLIKKSVDERKYHQISNGRRDALVGAWQGIIHQRQGQLPSDYDLSVTFDPGKRVVQGTGTLTIGPIVTTISLRGGFYDDKYLRLEYENQNKGVIQYGLAMFDFSANSAELRGEFLGYGFQSEQMVSGELILEKRS